MRMVTTEAELREALGTPANYRAPLWARFMLWLLRL